MLTGASLLWQWSVSDRCGHISVYFAFLKDEAASHSAEVTHQPLCLSSCSASFIEHVTWKYVLVVAPFEFEIRFFFFFHYITHS